MNKFKLYLDNFQSISSGELEFTTGQNFIIGQSNSGKTATFRAIKACLLNPKGSQRFIKKGYKQASVTVEYNGNSITWKRTPKESSYVINGEDYVKTGSSNAFKILENNIGLSQGLNNSSIMNIEEELDIPFPFGFSGSDLFKLFENVFCISDSAVILKSAKEYEDRTKKEIENLEADILKNERKVKALEEFKNEVDINKLLNYKAKLVNSNAKLISLKKDLPFIKKVKSLEDSNIVLNSYLTKVDLVNSRAKLIDCKALTSKLKELHKIGKSIPQELTLNPTMVEAYRNLKMLRKIYSIPVDFELYIKSEDKTAHLKTLYSLQQLVAQLKGLHRIKVASSVNIETLKDRIVRYEKLMWLKTYIKEHDSRILEQEKKLRFVKDSIAKFNEELSKFKVCPLCHQPLKNCQELKNVLK